jgi:hypothetical protein
VAKKAVIDEATLRAVHAAARRDYEARWRLLDEVLYGLCTLHPGHADRAGVNVKLYLIGRAFASGIERQIKSDGTQGGALRKLGDHLVANAAALDREIARLPTTATPTDDGLRTVVEVHGAVVKLIQPVLHRGTPRSFVSKYLHFHSLSVPIYDSVVVANLPKYITDADPATWAHGKPVGDPHYRWFVLHVRALLRRLEALGGSPTVRSVEWMLAVRSERWQV